MRRAWLSLAAIALTACGAAGPAATLDPTAAVGGVEITVRAVAVDDRSAPDLHRPSGTHCVSYTLAVRSQDGRRHDLRPDEFQAGGGTPADAVARCLGQQLEPTWIDAHPRTVVVTILEGADAPAPLSFAPD